MGGGVNTPVKLFSSQLPTDSLGLTDYHDVEVKARLHGLLPHLFDDGVNTNIAHQNGSTGGPVGACMGLTPVVCCGETPDVAHSVAGHVTPDGDRNGTWRQR